MVYYKELINFKKQKTMRNIHSGNLENDCFNGLLNEFDEIKPEDAKAKDKWKKLIEAAKQREPSTLRQKQAVIARCENQINGTYGMSKVASNFGHTKTN